MGRALLMVAEQLKMPPMKVRGFPPVLILITDGCPRDNVSHGLKALMSQSWGKEAVRIGVAIGADADYALLQQFIGNPAIKPLQANNAEDLVQYIKWASTAVIQASSTTSSL